MSCEAKAERRAPRSKPPRGGHSSVSADQSLQLYEVRSSPARSEGQEIEPPTSAFLQQVTHQATHTLARFMLEIDANYKQLQTATRLRAAAAAAHEAQRDYTRRDGPQLDRYLDARSQYATAVAQQAQFKTTYNVSSSLSRRPRERCWSMTRSPWSIILGPIIPAISSPMAKQSPRRSRPRPRRASNLTGGLSTHSTPVKTDEAKATTPDVDAPGRTISFQLTIKSAPTGRDQRHLHDQPGWIARRCYLGCALVDLIFFSL